MVILPISAWGDEALIAVATNFSEVMGQLEDDFEVSSGHDVEMVAGSSGKLYAQIRNGAPFDVFLSADQERPRLLENAGDAVKGSRFTYAIGKLTLWSPDGTLIDLDGSETLRMGNFRRLAMANATLAPYGAAARDLLEALGIYEQLQSRIAVGENVGQVWAMISTGNAELGLVALSYVLSKRNETAGSRWDVPQDFYRPIRQDAVLLRRANNNSAAIAFLHWLSEPRAKAIIEEYGYGVR